mmetsp:Transcript_15423/g.33475  ORF Transcript_15423/g.33475 Transcript_15423/m.33475 type:complete len:135 (-) Transcript_15423:131-535(-)
MELLRTSFMRTVCHSQQLRPHRVHIIERCARRSSQPLWDGYTSPDPKELAGPLLDQCDAAMWRKINERDPNDTLVETFCSAYCSHGWDSVDNIPLINSAFISANDGGVYWRSVDTTGKSKNAKYCAALMIEVSE